MSPETQAAFAHSLLDPAAAPVATRDARRFGVWRNNVVVSLTEALEAAYPAVLALAGADFFRAAAREFVRARPPRSPVLILWGGDFGDFLDAFPPAAAAPFLGDVARLEWARREAHHAADAAPVGIDALAGLPPVALALARLELHPSLRLVRSRFPVVSLWAECTGRAPRSALDLDRPETGLVVRPFENVETSSPDASTAGFLDALAAGSTLGEAAAAGMEAGDFDLAAGLAGLFAAGCVSGLARGPSLG